MRPITCNCGTCRKCKHRAYMREWNARNPGVAAAYVRRRRENDPEALRAYDRMKYAASPAKFRARIALNSAVRRGLLSRQPCEVCGAEQVEGHHEDYSRPLDVRWLCSQHHRELHLAGRV